MKKTILVIIGLVAIATPAMAMTQQGYGGSIDCLPSTQVWDGVARRCRDTEDMFKRLYELEGMVISLESRVNSLQTTCNSQPIPITSTGDDSRVASLENRVSKIESALNFIQTTVVQAFSTTIGLLQKLIK